LEEVDSIGGDVCGFWSRVARTGLRNLLGISATQFLPRNAMHKCSLCCSAVSVCSAAWVSVTFVYCRPIRTSQYILRLVLTIV